MATDSDGKLTKFESAVTVVTADFANSIFGGLFGSAAADSMDSEDPRVRGHTHDGAHANGHSAKIHLVDHVEDKLQNPNLGDMSVMKTNVWYSDTQSYAIPEYTIDGDTGVKNYYLNLSAIRSDFTFHEVESPSGADHGGLENRLIRQRIEDPPMWETVDGYDFVVGSESLDDLNSSTAGDSRMLFDKSLGAFRAGTVDGTQWDEPSRGNHSVAFGHNTEASGSSSTVSGGRNNSATAGYTTVGGGDGNIASGVNAAVGGGYNNQATNDDATVGGGYANRASAPRATVAGGYSNQAANTGASVGGGILCDALNQYSTVGGGSGNVANADFATISGGNTNTADGEYASIGGGSTNTADGTSSVTAGGDSNDSDSDYAAVLGGQGNHANAAHASIGGGQGNLIDDSSGNKPDHSNISGGYHNNILDQSTYSNISGGQDNQIGVDAAGEPSAHSAVGGGQSNQIYGGADHSMVGGGQSNQIYGGSAHSAVCGGRLNGISNNLHSFIGSGKLNTLSSPAPAGYSGIVTGESNTIQQSTHSIIGSGLSNGIGNAGSSPYSSISSGSGNDISGSQMSTISGGEFNIVSFSPHSNISGGKSNVIEAASDASFIGGGESNNIDENSSQSIIVGGVSNEIIADSMLGAIVCGKKNKISQTSIISAIISGEENNIVASSKSTILNGHGNYIGSGPSGGSTSSAIAYGSYSKAYLPAHAAHASGKFAEDFVGGFGGASTDANGGVGSAQKSNFVAFGNWTYGDTYLGAGDIYRLTIGGAGRNLKLQPGHAYSYNISGVLNFHGYDNPGVLSKQCAISLDTRGLFLMPSGGLNAEVIHSALSYSSTPAGGGWKTSLSGTSPTPFPGPAEFEFFISALGNEVIFEIRENNAIAGSPNYSSAVINVEMVECGQYWDGTIAP